MMAQIDTVGAWLQVIDQRYPAHTTATWDNSGLQVGDTSWPVARVLVTLDVTTAVLDEARAVAHTLVVAHHPLFFHPLKRLTSDTAAGKLTLYAARNAIAVTAAHTNLDVAQDGTSTSAPLARLLELTNVTSLSSAAQPAGSLKLVTFVPDTAVVAVRDALVAAGAGEIGAYTDCSFVTPGIGTFRPSPAANPVLSATHGVTASVAELRLEMVLPHAKLGAAIDALKASHPYEEVAYDVFERVSSGEQFGLIGTLKTPATIGALAAKIAHDLPAPDLRVAGDRNATVTTVAVCGGAGDSLIGAALARGAELYITGDLKHHVALDAQEMGLALLDVGHHASEVAALPHVIAALTADAAHHGLVAPVLASQINTSPWS